MAQKMTLDFSAVKDGGNFAPKHKPEGEYLGTIVSFEDTKSKKTNAPMWVYGVALKSDRRAVYPVYCLLGPDQVWKLRNMMEAAGVRVPKRKMSVDGTRLIGKDVGICLEDDEYEGKKKSVISAFFPASEYEGTDADGSDSDEEDEEPEEDEEYEDEVPEDDEESDEDEADDTDDEDSDEDEDDEEEDEPDDTDDEDSDEDEDDEEEDEPEPAPKKAAAKKAPARAVAKKKAAPVEDDDEDEDEMDVEDL